jgi:hypothetical protein
MSRIQELVFVYNADSGPLQAVMDSLHKLISPSTYNCSLCALTYHSFGEKKQWKAFRSKIQVPMKFLHRDEFLEVYTHKDYKLPLVMSIVDGKSTLLLDKSELDNFANLEELIQALTQKLQTN